LLRARRTAQVQIAKAYLAGTDSGITTRKWSHAMAVLIESREGANAARWQRAVKDSAFDLIHNPTRPRLRNCQ
jgi:hypothetical protein